MAGRRRIPPADPAFAAQIAEAERIHHEAWLRDHADAVNRPAHEPPPLQRSVLHRHAESCYDGPSKAWLVKLPGGSTATVRGRWCKKIGNYVIEEVLA